MKLAQALLLRSEYQVKIANLQSRILANVKVQEGEKPHEDPEDLLAESFRLCDEQAALIKKINQRNMLTTLPNGETLAEALATRDLLQKKRNLLADIGSFANEKDYRLTRAEIKTLVVLPIGELQKEIDRLAKAYRELDAKIQEVNWTTEL